MKNNELEQTTEANKKNSNDDDNKTININNTQSQKQPNSEKIEDISEKEVIKPVGEFKGCVPEINEELSFPKQEINQIIDKSDKKKEEQELNDPNENFKKELTQALKV